MIRRRSLFLTLFLTFGLLLGMTSQAFAKKRDKDDLARVLGDIQWGDSKSQVLEKIKAQRMETLTKDKKLRKDPRKMQLARKKALDWHERVSDSYVRFEGKRTGYEASIVQTHYTERNGESMLRAKDKVAQRFFFFMDGQLYKLVVAYDHDYLKGVGFESFAAQAARTYGRPVSTEYAELMGEEELVKVTWQDKTNILDIENYQEFFGTYAMVFSDRARVERLQAAKRNFGGSDKTNEEVISGEVAALTRNEGGDKNKDVVDSIVGNVDLDLNEGRPKDEQIRQPQPGEKSDEDDGKAAKKKKTAKKKKKRKKKKVSKRDFSDLKDKAGDDELIIY
jgi:hypothetical protein